MRKVLTFALSLIVLFALAACGGDGDAMPSETYDLAATGALGTSVSGTVTFEKVSDTSTKITIDVDGTPEGGSHPAHIHEGSSEDAGAIYISLTAVDGDTGMSETTVTATGAGAAVTYEDLIAYDGYVNVHLSSDDLTVVSTGETGAGE